MSITAKYAGKCSTCGQAIAIGSTVEWSKGSPARHVACTAAAGTVSQPAPAKRRSGGVWDAQQFRGYGRKTGGWAKRCPTDGNCSSFGSGRSCGSPDCDGY